MGNVRLARHSDVPRMAQMLLGASRGKASAHSCRSVADRCVRRGQKRDGSYCHVADDGFLFAEERHAFDLAENIVWVEVHYLVGGDARKLLKRLRKFTHKRIIVPTWVCLGREKAMLRLLRSLGYRRSGTIMES